MSSLCIPSSCKSFEEGGQRGNDHPECKVQQGHSRVVLGVKRLSSLQFLEGTIKELVQHFGLFGFRSVGEVPTYRERRVANYKMSQEL